MLNEYKNPRLNFIKMTGFALDAGVVTSGYELSSIPASLNTAAISGQEVFVRVMFQDLNSICHRSSSTALRMAAYLRKADSLANQLALSANSGLTGDDPGKTLKNRTGWILPPDRGPLTSLLF